MRVGAEGESFWGDVAKLMVLVFLAVKVVVFVGVYQQCKLKIRSEENKR